MLHKESDTLNADDSLVFSGIRSKSSLKQKQSHDSEASASSVSGDSDIVGIGGSFLCLIHCLAPQLISLGLLGAGIGSWFTGEIWALVFWITCLWAVFKSAGAARFPAAALFLWFAFFLFSAGLVLETFFGAAKLVSYISSLCLIIAHIWSYRLQVKSSRVINRIRHEAYCGNSAVSM